MLRLPLPRMSKLPPSRGFSPSRLVLGVAGVGWVTSPFGDGCSDNLVALACLSLFNLCNGKQEGLFDVFSCSAGDVAVTVQAVYKQLISIVVLFQLLLLLIAELPVMSDISVLDHDIP